MLFRKESYKFKAKEHSKKGIAGMLIGLLSFFGVLLLSVISGRQGGQGGIELGFLGLGCEVLSVFGFFLSMMSLKEKDIYLTPPILGLVVNGLLIVTYFSLYIIGMLS